MEITTGGRGFAEFLHSAKSSLHSAKALPSVALGKVRSAKIFSAKGLCRVLFIGALGKIIFLKKVLCRVPPPRHSARFFLFFLKIYFAECPCPGTRQSFFLFFLNNFFAECPCLGTRQRISEFFLKKYFAECRGEALGKENLYFFLKNLCRVPCPWHSAKTPRIAKKKLHSIATVWIPTTKATTCLHVKYARASTQL